MRGSGPAELIAYERVDSHGSKESQYAVYRMSDPAGQQKVLAATLGTRGVVHKRRTVFLAGRTRVHLDGVEGLSEFVELEVVLRPGQDAGDGLTLAQQFMARLGTSPDQLMDRAYIDLLA